MNLRTAIHLGLITSLGSLLVLWVSEFTEHARTTNRMAAERARLMELVQMELPEYLAVDSNGLDALSALCDGEGHLKTALVRGTGSGYAGEIEFVAAINGEGKLSGVRVTSHSETPGIGDVIEPAKSPWIHGLDGRDASTTRWELSRDGGDIDGVTGASITLRGLVRGVGEALRAPLPECGE